MLIERETGCAGVGDRARDHADVRVRGRELRVERELGGGATRGDDLRGGVGRLVDVRAREVELDRCYTVECGAGLCVIGGAEAADRDPERQPELAEPRQRVGEEALAAGVREADRVQHPVRRLGDARRRIALPRERGDRLRHEGVELPRDLRRGERVEAAARVKQQGALVLPGRAA